MNAYRYKIRTVLGLIPLVCSDAFIVGERRGKSPKYTERVRYFSLCFARKHHEANQQTEEERTDLRKGHQVESLLPAK